MQNNNENKFTIIRIELQAEIIRRENVCGLMKSNIKGKLLELFIFTSLTNIFVKFNIYFL